MNLFLIWLVVGVVLATISRFFFRKEDGYEPVLITMLIIFWPGVFVVAFFYFVFYLLPEGLYLLCKKVFKGK